MKNYTIYSLLLVIVVTPQVFSSETINFEEFLIPYDATLPCSNHDVLCYDQQKRSVRDAKSNARNVLRDTVLSWFRKKKDNTYRTTLFGNSSDKYQSKIKMEPKFNFDVSGNNDKVYLTVKYNF